MTDTTASRTASTFEPEWSFGDRLRKSRREFTAYGQKEMAEALGVGVQAYSAWEAGRSTPRNLLEVAVALEKITNVSRHWFVGWTAPAAEQRPSD